MPAVLALLGGPDREERKSEERAARESRFSLLVYEFVERYAKVHQREWKESERILKKNVVPIR